MSTQHEELVPGAISMMLQAADIFNSSYDNKKIAVAVSLSGIAWELLAKAVLIKENITPPNSMSSWGKVWTDDLYRHFKDTTGLGERQMQVIHWVRDKRNDSVHSGQSPAGNPKNHHKHLAKSQSLFNEVVGKYFPESLVQIAAAVQREVDKLGQVSADIAQAILIGSWDSSNASDVAILDEMLDKKYDSCKSEMRKIASTPSGLLTITGDIWSMPKRKLAWSALGPYITKHSIDTFRKASTKVLSGSGRPAYSSHLKRGIAEGLALLASYSHELPHCPDADIEADVVELVRAVFKGADSSRWRWLDELLPTLAEAEPGEFLEAVRKALEQNPCPLNQQSLHPNGLTSMHTPNLLWALEGTAWHTEHLVPTCRLLSKLAANDKGESVYSGNRPIHSLTNILLPWLPQTMAPPDLRKRAVKAVQEESSEVGWELSVSLLPIGTEISMYTHRPAYRQDIPAEEDLQVTRQEFEAQGLAYADMAISWAGSDSKKLAELVNSIGKMFLPSAENLLKHLESDEVAAIPEEERSAIWRQLIELPLILEDEPEFKQLLKKIKAVASKLAPSSPSLKYQHIFSHSSLYVLGGRKTLGDDKDRERHETLLAKCCQRAVKAIFKDGGKDRERHETLLAKRRQRAVKAIFKDGGMEALVKFAESVDTPDYVGDALGSISNGVTAQAILPQYLCSDNSNASLLAKAFIRRRHEIDGWGWVDGLDRSDWTPEQQGILLSALPFRQETWERADNWLKGDQDQYWAIVEAHAYIDPSNADFAVGKLLKHDRPRPAIRCLGEMLYKQCQPDLQQCIDALKAVANSNESILALDKQHIVDLTKYIRRHRKGSDDLATIESMYQNLLEGSRYVKHNEIHARLSSDPAFFHSFVRFFYVPTANNPQKSTKLNISKGKAWRILEEWSSPPGKQDDGSFDTNAFEHWFKKVDALCETHDYKDQALRHIGQVLIHIPEGSYGGMWIPPEVATILDIRENSALRDGYVDRLHAPPRTMFMAANGMSGMYKEYGEKCRDKANQAELEGYSNLADTLNKAARAHEWNAKKWRDRQQSDEP